MVRLPSLSFRRRIRYEFRRPSGSTFGIRNRPRPRPPAAAPSGLASNTASSASTLEQNHFSPHSFQSCAVANRNKLGGSDIGTAGLLRHELRALEQRGGVLTPHPLEISPAQFIRSETAHQFGRAVGEVDGAKQAELGLRKQIVKHVFCDRRHRRRPAKHTAAVAHRVHSEFSEGDAFHLAIGGMIFDPLLIAAVPVARMQHRLMTLGLVRQIMQPASGELTELRKVRLEMRKQRPSPCNGAAGPEGFGRAHNSSAHDRWAPTPRRAGPTRRGRSVRREWSWASPSASACPGPNRAPRQISAANTGV